MGVIIDILRCEGCGSCIYLCPAGLLDIDGGKCRVRAGCNACGACLGICPLEAIKLEDKKPED